MRDASVCVSCDRANEGVGPINRGIIGGMLLKGLGIVDGAHERRQPTRPAARTYDTVT